MNRLLAIWIFLFLVVLVMQGCMTTTAVVTADDTGIVVRPVIPMTPTMMVVNILTGFAISHCSTEPEFRGCSDIFCQMDSSHRYCTQAARDRLHKKGIKL